MDVRINNDWQKMDYVTLTYKGNQLIHATDTVNGPNYPASLNNVPHFHDKTITGNEHMYDSNGNILYNVENGWTNYSKPLIFNDLKRIANYMMTSKTGKNLWMQAVNSPVNITINVDYGEKPMSYNKNEQKTNLKLGNTHHDVISAEGNMQIYNKQNAFIKLYEYIINSYAGLNNMYGEDVEAGTLGHEIIHAIDDRNIQQQERKDSHVEDKPVYMETEIWKELNKNREEQGLRNDFDTFVEKQFIVPDFNIKQ